MENTTPGNWHVWVTPGDTLYIATEKNVHIASLLHDGKSPEEVARNASVLAASKDLLYAAYLAIEEIEQWVAVMGGSEDERTAAAIEALREAIDRAEGKTPLASC